MMKSYPVVGLLQGSHCKNCREKMPKVEGLRDASYPTENCCITRIRRSTIGKPKNGVDFIHLRNGRE